MTKSMWAGIGTLDYTWQRSGLPQGVHWPKGLETQLEFLFVVALKFSPFIKDFRGGELL